MPETLTKIPVMVLKHKQKADRFLALSIEHTDWNDPDGDVLLEDIVNAHVIHRHDHLPPTQEDINAIVEESNARIFKMHQLFGPDAHISSYNFSQYLETYEPFHTEVDVATFNRICFENEWSSFIGKVVEQVSAGEWVMLPPFDQEPTIQNVYVVQEVDDNYIEIEGMRGWLRIPKYEPNFKIMDAKQIKYEFPDNTSDKYKVTVAEHLEYTHLQFNTGWSVHEVLKFEVNDIEFCVNFDFPSAVLSDARAGIKVGAFIIPVSSNELDILKRWILSDPLAMVIDIFENKLSPEAFQQRVEALETKGIEKFGPKPNLNSISLHVFIEQKREELLKQYRKVELHSHNSVVLKDSSVAEKFTSGETFLMQVGREVTTAEFPRDVPMTAPDNGTEVVFEVVSKGKRKPERYSCYFLWE